MNGGGQPGRRNEARKALVLDATCSRARRWPLRADMRIDVAMAALPDVLADASRLPFKGSTFARVYCDPPHMVAFDGDISWREDWGAKLPVGFRRFSYWQNRAKWLAFLHESGKEFHRVLIPGGTLHYKVPDGSRSHGRMIDVSEVRSLAGFRVINDIAVRSQSVLSRTNVKRRCSPTIVHYLTMKRLPCDGASSAIESDV